MYNVWFKRRIALCSEHQSTDSAVLYPVQTIKSLSTSVVCDFRLHHFTDLIYLGYDQL